MSANQ